MSTEQGTTHFGFKTIPSHEKNDRVREVFDSVVDQYDLMNDAMSFGLHRWWKFLAIAFTHLRPGQKVLDVAAGTGDLTARIAEQVGEKGNVIFTDINAAMLQKGRDQLLNRGFYKNIRAVQANAEALPFLDHSFDAVTIGFGLRNVTDKAAALRSMARVLKAGGSLTILEFSSLRVSCLKPLYDFYSFTLLPRLGRWLARDEESYRYLAESIRKHPNQEELRELVLNNGFVRCDYFNLMGGVVAIHRAYKV